MTRQPAAADAALVVESVSKNFGAVKALDDVSLTVAPSEILGLMGPNGSGKSTLVNAISGVGRATSGRVLIGDRVLTGLAPDAVARAGIARTFQNVRLFRELSVRDNVASVLRGNRRSLDSHVSSLLERLSISHLEKDAAGSLPYGLQRRLEIARALATRPRFLLLDEPAAGLNDIESEELEQVIRSLAKDGGERCGVLIIDHDMRLLSSLCDRLHVLLNGRTLAVGGVAEVRGNPEVVAAYLGQPVSESATQQSKKKGSKRGAI
jgi:ABC-type branched-subunit amino acid transport system ATPase component